MLYRSVVIIALLVWPTAGLAQSWVELGPDSKNAVWSIDSSSVKQVTDGYNGSVSKSWVKMDYSKDRTHTSREARVLFFVKCAQEQLKWVSWIEYDSSGSVLKSDTNPLGAYQPAVPESMGAAVLAAMCK